MPFYFNNSLLLIKYILQINIQRIGSIISKKLQIMLQIYRQFNKIIYWQFLIILSQYSIILINCIDSIQKYLQYISYYMIANNYQFNQIDRRRREIQRRIFTLQQRFQTTKQESEPQIIKTNKQYQRVLNQQRICEVKDDRKEKPVENIRQLEKPQSQKYTQTQKLYNLIKSTIQQQNNLLNELNQLKLQVRNNDSLNNKSQANLKTRQNQAIRVSYNKDDKIVKNFPQKSTIALRQPSKAKSNVRFELMNKSITQINKDKQKQYNKEQLYQDQFPRSNTYLNDTINQNKAYVIENKKMAKKQQSQSERNQIVSRQSPNKFDFLRQYEQLSNQDKLEENQKRKSSKSYSHREKFRKPKLNQDIKGYLAAKIQDRLRESQQNYKDSDHKNAKHQHHHLLNTFQLQKKLRDDVIRKIHQLRDIKRYK